MGAARRLMGGACEDKCLNVKRAPAVCAVVVRLRNKVPNTTVPAGLFNGCEAGQCNRKPAIGDREVKPFCQAGMPLTPTIDSKVRKVDEKVIDEWAVTRSEPLNSTSPFDADQCCGRGKSAKAEIALSASKCVDGNAATKTRSLSPRWAIRKGHAELP